MMVIGITLFTMHPLILGYSLVGSLLFFGLLNSVQAVLKEIGFYLFVFLLIALAYPLFNHNGITILFFLNNNAMTQEAIGYGIALAVKMIAFSFWCKSYSEVMTTDKFIYLFGKRIPKLALVFSRILRFVPQFKMQFKKVNQAQKTVGFYTSTSITDRLFGSVKVFKTVLVWSLERVFKQAVSMKARGYGLKGRTHFSLFTYQKSDVALFFLLFLMSVNFLFVIQVFTFYYYPEMSTFEQSKSGNLQHFIVFILMIIPSSIEAKGNLQWKFLKSKM